jgi:hypothetical protein
MAAGVGYSTGEQREKTMPQISEPEFEQLPMAFTLANPVWAHGGGGGGGGAGGGGSAGGNGAGHGGGNGSSMGGGHSSAMGFSHSSHAATLSARGSHSHSTHLSRHSREVTSSRSVAHHSRAHQHSTRTTEVAQNEALRGKKKGFIDGLPPGLELQLDRGRSLPPGWQSKVGPGTILSDTDTPADLSLSSGQEIQTDRAAANQ